MNETVFSNMLSMTTTDKRQELKKIHLLAISQVLNTPMEIFENRDLNSEKKIKEFWKKYKSSKKRVNQKTINKQNDEILKDLCGEWYYYHHASNFNISNKEIWEDKVTISKDYSANNFHNKSNYTGKIEIDSLQFVIKVKKIRSNFFIIADNNKRFDNIFYVNIVTKTISLNRDVMEFGIFSKNKLPPEIVKHILGDKNKNQLLLDYKFQERIVENFNSQKPLQIKKTPYDKDIILEKLIGKWYMQVYHDKNIKHTFIIDNNLNVEWFIDNNLQEEGKLTINKFYSIIECTDKRGVNSYFLFKSMSEDGILQTPSDN